MNKARRRRLKRQRACRIATTWSAVRAEWRMRRTTFRTPGTEHTRWR